MCPERPCDVLQTAPQMTQSVGDGSCLRPPYFRCSLAMSNAVERGRFGIDENDASDSAFCSRARSIDADHDASECRNRMWPASPCFDLNPAPHCSQIADRVIGLRFDPVLTGRGSCRASSGDVRVSGGYVVTKSSSSQVRTPVQRTTPRSYPVPVGASIQ